MIIIDIQKLESNVKEKSLEGEKQMPKTINSLDDLKHDPVNKPAHYNNGSVEAIDYIKQQLGKEFPAYLVGSAIKYIHRHKYKDANIQDLEKAVWYINKLIEHYNNL
jgi:hypothetical protein